MNNELLPDLFSPFPPSHPFYDYWRLKVSYNGREEGRMKEGHWQAGNEQNPKRIWKGKYEKYRRGEKMEDFWEKGDEKIACKLIYKASYFF